MYRSHLEPPNIVFADFLIDQSPQTWMIFMYHDKGFNLEKSFCV